MTIDVLAVLARAIELVPICGPANQRVYARFDQLSFGINRDLREASAAVAELIEAAIAREAAQEAYLQTIPAGSEVCTSDEKDAYRAACARFDTALANVQPTIPQEG